MQLKYIKKKNKKMFEDIPNIESKIIKIKNSLKCLKKFLMKL